MKNNHLILMFLPILLIIFLPIFGFSQDDVFLLAIILMFGLHFFMMGSHNHKQKVNNRNNGESKATDPLIGKANTIDYVKQDLHRKNQRRQF